MGMLLDNRIGQLILLTTVCAALMAVGVYAVVKVRGELRDTEPDASDMMTNFREIHSAGKLSDEEFRKIKTSLVDRLEEELKDSGEEG